MYTLSIVTKFHTEPHYLLGGFELRVGFTLWGGFCILGLRLRSERRLRLNLHSMVLRDVVTLWVESVFILDRNEGFAFFSWLFSLV